MFAPFIVYLISAVMGCCYIHNFPEVSENGASKKEFKRPTLLPCLAASPCLTEKRT